MRKLLLSFIGICFLLSEIQAATQWDVSLWGKRRAFTENVEKLSELVAAKN